MLEKIRQDLIRLKNAERAKNAQWFFQTGPGQYAEGDIFYGITVPNQRKVAKKYPNLTFIDLQELLSSGIHEERLVALFIMVNQYQKASAKLKKQLVTFYLKNAKRVNNWDLVDSSAHKILGAYLLDKPKAILYRLANSKNLWEKRIAIIATFMLIKNNLFDDALAIAEKLLNDKHDLIHKAVCWMLREVGKRNIVVEENFLRQHYKTMPRTMLCYAIEKFPPYRRVQYLKGLI